MSSSTAPTASTALNTTNPRCLVTGATGYIGGRLISELLSAGMKVDVLVRTPAKLQAVPWVHSVTIHHGDLTDKRSLEQAFAGIDVVYYLVHSMGSSDNFEEAERDCARNLSQAAAKAGVGRVVYLSGLHPSGVDLSPHLRSRVEVGQILLASEVPTLVLQAGVVIGSGSASFEMIRHLTERLPIMTTPRWVHNHIQPIAIDDALHYLRSCSQVPLVGNGVFDIGGPDVLTYSQMMQEYAQVAGLRTRHMLVIPGLSPSLASRWVGLVTPIPGGLAMPLVESLACDAVVDDNSVDSIIPPPSGGMTPFRLAVEKALECARDGEPGRSWSVSAHPPPPSRPWPSDASWAGATVRSSTRTVFLPVSADVAWDALCAATRSRWDSSIPIELEIVEHGSPAQRRLVRMSAPGLGRVLVSFTPSENVQGVKVLIEYSVWTRGLAQLISLASCAAARRAALYVIARGVRRELSRIA